jgi:hypothetical protein
MRILPTVCPFIYRDGSFAHGIANKKTAWRWEKEAEKPFQDMKRVLTATAVLAHPIPEKTQIVTTDASKHGLGAILSQSTTG